MIVVTRYFGGVLLGTGGLVKAYSTSARDSVLNAQKAVMIPCTKYETVCEYTDHNKLVSLLENSNAKIEDTEYTDKVKISYVFKDTDFAPFATNLQEYFSARLTADEVEKIISPFEIKTENL